ncbi:hypothetical protein AB3S75_032503 [Citrus x aurantiifolia]
MMRKASMFFPVLLLLVSALVLHDVDAARIPEHTCHKLINSNKCESQKCIQECSEQFSGVGECKQTFCFCTYYCKDPPM